MKGEGLSGVAGALFREARGRQAGESEGAVAPALVEDRRHVAAMPLETFEQPIGAVLCRGRGRVVEMDGDRADEGASVVPPTSLFRAAIFAVDLVEGEDGVTARK